jgi:nicotinamide-nucleotide amidase
MISSRITNVPGSSRYFLGGFVVYSNESKRKFLKVTPETLDGYGAVSSRTAIEMAQGAREAFNSTIGIAVTGIAGPGGGSREKPLGLVFIGISDRTATRAFEFRYPRGTRRSIREKTTRTALELLVQALKDRD